VLLRAIGEGKADAPEQILARWTWRLARAARKVLDRKASQEYPEAKRLLGALANSRGHRHEENAAKLVNTARELPLEVAVALLASAEGYTPRATQLIEAAREKIAPLAEVAAALAENLPAPKTTPGKSRRRRRRKKKGQAEAADVQQEQQGRPEQQDEQASQAGPPADRNGDAPVVATDGGPGEGESKPKRRRRRSRRPSVATTDGAADGEAAAAEVAAPAADAS
jgi:hypothetical protein